MEAEAAVASEGSGGAGRAVDESKRRQAAASRRRTPGTQWHSPEWNVVPGPTRRTTPTRPQRPTGAAPPHPAAACRHRAARRLRMRSLRGGAPGWRGKCRHPQEGSLAVPPARALRVPHPRRLRYAAGRSGHCGPCRLERRDNARANDVRTSGIGTVIQVGVAGDRAAAGWRAYCRASNSWSASMIEETEGRSLEGQQRWRDSGAGAGSLGGAAFLASRPREAFFKAEHKHAAAAAERPARVCSRHCGGFAAFEKCQAQEHSGRGSSNKNSDSKEAA